jgi:hypothetical protein
MCGRCHAPENEGLLAPPVHKGWRNAPHPRPCAQSGHNDPPHPPPPPKPTPHLCHVCSEPRGEVEALEELCQGAGVQGQPKAKATGTSAEPRERQYCLEG